MESHRNAERLERAFAQITGAISGAVGTYATLGPDYEERVMANLGLRARGHLDAGRPARPPRRAAVSAIALAGAGLERFATEIRHLQRTEVREVEEPFRARARRARARCRTSATRSSASASAASRGCCAATRRSGLENVALWHERDITHSSAERIVLPDSTILLDQVLRARRCASCAA